MSWQWAIDSKRNQVRPSVNCELKSLFCPVCLLQSWIRSQPRPHAPTSPSPSSSTAGTSGRTCVCSASPRKSPQLSWRWFIKRCSPESLLSVCVALYLPAWLPLRAHISPGFFHSEPFFYLSPVCKHMPAYSLFFCASSLRFISHGISHCYSSFRGDVRGTAPSFYWTYLLSVCAGGGAWLLLWATVDRCGRRGILLLSMTMTGLASLILLGLMECKRALLGRRILFSPSKSRVR